MNWKAIIAKDPVGSRWTTLVTVMLARLLILALIVLALSGLTKGNVDVWGVSLFLALTFLITIIYSFWLRHDERTVRTSVLYQFTVDVFIITGLIHFTGGIESVLSLLYPLVILAAGIVVSGRMALKVALLALVLYSTMIVLEATGTLPYQGTSNPYDDSAAVYQTLMMEVLLFVMFAAAASYLSDQYLSQARQLKRLRIIARATLDNVAMPLIAFDRGGTVVTANPGACAMLGIAHDDLKGTKIGDMFLKESPRLDSPEDASHLWWMKRGDGGRVPVSYQASTGNFPAALVNAFQENDDELELTLVAVRDVSALMEEQKRREQGGRTVGAVGMITEMAHVVRNPLTAIRGANDLINSAVEAALARQHEITSDDFVNLKSLCNLISEQVQSLDGKVDAFMFATGDEKKLNEIMTEADKWASRILKRQGENEQAGNIDSR